MNNIDNILKIAGFTYEGELGNSDGITHKWVYFKNGKPSWIKKLKNYLRNPEGEEPNKYWCHVHIDHQKGENYDGITLQGKTFTYKLFKEIFEEEFIKLRDKKITSILKKK